MPVSYAVPNDYDEDAEETTPDGLIEIGLLEDPTRLHYRGSGGPIVCPTCGYTHVLNEGGTSVTTSGLVAPGQSVNVRRHLRRSTRGRVSAVREHARMVR